MTRSLSAARSGAAQMAGGVPAASIIMILMASACSSGITIRVSVLPLPLDVSEDEEGTDLVQPLARSRNSA
ncbi:hypothetical protein PG984_015247 [Apiospora sp. TS-2023a]